MYKSLAKMDKQFEEFSEQFDEMDNQFEELDEMDKQELYEMNRQFTERDERDETDERNEQSECVIDVPTEDLEDTEDSEESMYQHLPPPPEACVEICERASYCYVYANGPGVVSETKLPEILQAAAMVETFSIDRCVQFTDEFIKQLAQKLFFNSRIKTLELTYSGLTIDGAMRIIDALNGSSIRTINLTMNQDLTQPNFKEGEDPIELLNEFRRHCDLFKTTHPDVVIFV